MKFLLSLIFLTLSLGVLAEPSVSITVHQDDSRYSCENFKGVIQPQNRKAAELKLRINTEGFSEGVSFNVLYTNNGYQDLSLEKYVSYNTSSRVITIPYYRVSDDRHFAVNQVYVTADDDGQSASAGLNYTVSRNLVLEKAPEDINDCFTMYKSEKITGVYTNTSSQPRNVEITDRMTRSYLANSSKSSGWSFRLSPFAIIGFGKNKNYVERVARGVSLASSFNINTRISTGESLIFARQMTLFKDAYTIRRVDQCGGMYDEGTAFYHHWVVSYPVARVDFTLDNPLRNLDIGYDDQLNTCPEVIDTPVDGDDIDIFLPDTLEPDQLSANVKDPTVFNEIGKQMNDETKTKAKRKGIFKRFFRKIFKRK